MSTAIHGGDVFAVAEAYGFAPTELLDFSANINPRGLPPSAALRLQMDAADITGLTRYPDPHAWPLRRALSQLINVPPESIVVGEGAEALLGAAVRVFHPATCFVPVPAFSEYARICSNLHPFALDPESNFQLDIQAAIESECDLAIINNPHNPSGAFNTREQLRPLFSSGKNVLLDEAFIDYVPHESLACEAAQTPGVIVVRSLTKFYGCPSLRVGYAVAHPDVVENIRSLLPAWPVTQLALNALTVAVQDDEYRTTAISDCIKHREQLAQALKRMDMKVFPSSANFLLLRLNAKWPDASQLREQLITRHRILIRNCDSYSLLSKIGQGCDKACLE
ncbi:MAG: aminotransferase class I/II-fold pyridoxal phosphate-dependent enzyme [Acidobacteriota bacterium]|nr:aminotransferase class I/II-fold pyridoxal phosphate-dependent enzyme [Acidobacteriota bacterium]